MKKINIPTISPVLRITIGLLLLTISLLLMGDLLGIVPNQKQSEIDARKIMAESLAIQISSEIGENRLKQAVSLLNIIVDRNENIHSIGLRTNSKKLIMQSSEHEIFWAAREDDRSTPTHMQVPIYGQEERWGTLEVSFVSLGNIWSNIFTNRSFTAMLLFIFIFGFITYWLFLRRVLSELDPSSVVPDRVRSALDALTEGLVILDTNERIILANTALKKKLGLSETELIGKLLSNLSWEIEDNTLLLENHQLPWNILLETNEPPSSVYLKLKTVNQGTFIFNVNVAPIKAPNQKIKGVIVTIDDITELEKKNSELSHLLNRLEKSQNEIKRQNIELTELATRDPLTHALNRRSLFEGLHTLLTETRHQADVLSCIMVDIDHFKLVNDNYGHAMGDKVIQVLVNILQEAVQPNDLVSRYGGEEFIVILPGLNESEAAEVAEKMRLNIFELEHTEFPKDLMLSSSFGVTSTENNTWQADRLIDHADQALYTAKESGRNKVVCYSQKNKTPILENSSAVEKRSTREVERIEKPKEISLNATGESSRTIVLDRLTQAMKLAQRNKKNLAILTIFIDTIQLIDNTLGHASAAKLRTIAFKRLKEIFRSSDSITPKVNSSKNISLSPSSDSEFTAILSDIDNSFNITWAIHRMTKELAIPIEIDGNEIVMTANIGASIYPNDGEDPENLLANSKMALLKAREESRGTFLFYNQKMNDLSKQVLKIESQLHQAIEREELYLNFQPIINMKTGQVVKLEALLRWKHPELGLVSPNTFIEVAEHAGIIKTIGRWITQRACHQLKFWQMHGHPDLLISINLSAVQFHQTDLAEDIIDIVEKEGLSPNSIVLELTETVLLKQLDKVTKIISKLHSAGFLIALDDFGTGYSSLEHLQKFPIDLIKVDRSFMTNFPKEIHAISIVSGLISLSHNLGIRVIAEGVEQESQLAMLHNLKCDEVQGYLISKPLSVQDSTEFLTSTSPHRMIKKLSATHNDLKYIKNRASLADILNLPPSTSS